MESKPQIPDLETILAHPRIFPIEKVKAKLAEKGVNYDQFPYHSFFHPELIAAVIDLAVKAYDGKIKAPEVLILSISDKQKTDQNWNFPHHAYAFYITDFDKPHPSSEPFPFRTLPEQVSYQGKIINLSNGHYGVTTIGKDYEDTLRIINEEIKKEEARGPTALRGRG